ncbi:transporter, putative [Trichomonas vaginalis G3]|uniref:Lysosomal dipeptide transporter MFSD1 n=1 Tax=Trichomonas vaginalis (strain ATCC PRA-98 / G3) TaxID=412133 RepID=A2FKS6_TRIV3|nr:Major Facilitator Superfamily [Trichomonas vaginalis G3]EAX94500.1 transporter, putative [Trichomonas vaginalis G3]KAI5511004.1 Major Facilitator Superfamily [Trichomonas vaginalis G3]|eukprot:XP_001307430.1 transporter [Trichomonas vaginalis G3]
MDKVIEAKRPISFHIIRITLVGCLGILQVITAFQKTCPSIVAIDMAMSYNVEKHRLGTFAALYFYPYSVFQIISGLLVDYFDPVWVVTIFGILASAGSVMCGFSRNLFEGIIGRILVGIGTAPVLVGAMKIFRNWFKKNQVPIASGILMCHTCIGGVLAGKPLSDFCKYHSWRKAFYSIGGIGAFFSILMAIVARGRPERHGFAPVNEESKPTVEKSAKERVIQLFINMWKIVKYPYYWIPVAFVLMNVVPFINATSL